jgi:DNA repair exonuclease SbcCD ATPase subunit/DNA repair exonuclease SbcCD nuclease subunit
VRGIFAADVQAEFSNLDRCQLTWDFLVEYCEKNNLDFIAIVGDLKHQYNPVDYRVIQWWERAISSAKRRKLQVIVLLGNHDRIGLYDDSVNWLSTLRNAGATVADKPCVLDMGKGHLAMLPYTTSVKQLRKRAAELAGSRTWNNRLDILLFHNDIKNCTYNQLGQKSEARLRFSELHPEKYLVVLGGHIHLPQQLGKNGHYIGSPFAMDWGEANQRKRFVVVKDGKYESINSPIPGWFDPAWPGFYKTSNWKNCKIRLSVQCSKNSNYERELDRARKSAERRYPGAFITIVPRFVSGKSEREGHRPFKLEDRDSEKIKHYVKATLPKTLEAHSTASYLISKLEQAKGIFRNSGSVRFNKVEAENTLSFKKVYIDFDKLKGIVRVEGENKDWDNQSNGAGKSNTVQLVPIALFGTTFKGQKYNAWARRNTKKRAVVKLYCEDENGNNIVIHRGRRTSKKLQILINDKDQSSGLNRKNDGTQQLIEQCTGFTWQTLANSVYIDKDVTRTFLQGTKKDRMALLSRFQNLERFERALVLVKAGRTKLQKAEQQVASAIDILKTKILDKKEQLKDQKHDADARLENAKEEYTAGLKVWKKLHSRAKAAEKHARHASRNLGPKWDKLNPKIAKLDEQIRKASSQISYSETVISKHKKMLQCGSCPTCGTPVEVESIKTSIQKVEKEIKVSKHWLNDCNAKRQKLLRASAELEAAIDKAKDKAREAGNVASLKRNSLRNIREQIAKFQDVDQEAIRLNKKTLKKLEKELSSFRDYRESIYADKEFFKYCEEAFSRDGIPAFLNAQLCPILNKAAEHYSNLFCEKQILVRFEMENGELEPVVINLNGGAESCDQSTGEQVMVALITSFALKEIAPKSNILVLDEPTDGLSPHNVKQFARAIREIKKFETIFLVNHNPILSGELMEEKTLHVVKERGISRIEERT